MKKIEYIKCPRCELNYIQKKDKFCEVCKQEMKAGAIDEYELDALEEGIEICPVCKVNYLNEGESICAYCQEEKQAFDKDDIQDDWHSYIDKDTSDDDEDLDLLPVENDEIDEELDSAFAQDLDDDFADDLDEEDEMEHDDFDDLDMEFGDSDDFDDDDDDEDDFDDEDDDDDDDY